MTGVVPPTVHVTQVISAANAAEILLTFGHTRMNVFDAGAGEAPATALIEWLQTLSMSPTAAMSLHRILGEQLMKYAERFGPITRDIELEARVSKVIDGEIMPAAN
jgi:hypothetical protein